MIGNYESWTLKETGMPLNFAAKMIFANNMKMNWLTLKKRSIPLGSKPQEQPIIN
jgi:hypothetical protein